MPAEATFAGPSTPSRYFGNVSVARLYFLFGRLRRLFGTGAGLGMKSNGITSAYFKGKTVFDCHAEGHQLIAKRLTVAEP
jgi:hypothetical protein